MKKILLTLSLFLTPVWSQSDSPVQTQSLGPPNVAYQEILAYSGANTTPSYICKARSIQNPAPITVSAISQANPGVMTATGHGFYYNSSGPAAPSILALVSGLTGNWTPLNGYQVLTPASANSLTTTVNTSTFGAVTGTPVVVTSAPNTLKSYWSVQSLQLDSSGRVVLLTWAAPTTPSNGLSGGQTSFAFPCTTPGASQ